MNTRSKYHKKQPLAPYFTLSLDFGGSLTKGFYQDSRQQVASLAMEAEVASVSADAIAAYTKQSLGSFEPENAAWIGVGGQYKAVGYLAQQYYGNAGLKELKYERALYKTLAAIWLVAQRLQLGNSLSVAIAVLLPPGEYEDRNRFELMLKGAMNEFLTPTGKMNVTLKEFNCKPEGCGIYLMHSRKVGQPLKSKVCAITMLGYRNTSVLTSYRGEIRPGKTSELGFVRMVETVAARVSGLNEQKAVGAIARAGIAPAPEPLIKLCRSTTASGRSQDLQNLVHAIKTARHEYFLSLRSWLDNTLPSDVDEIVFCGGTADYLRPELAAYYQNFDLCWSADISIPRELVDSQMGNRFDDVYGLFLYFVSKARVTNGSETTN